MLACTLALSIVFAAAAAERDVFETALEKGELPPGVLGTTELKFRIPDGQCSGEVTIHECYRIGVSGIRWMKASVKDTVRFPALEITPVENQGPVDRSRTNKVVVRRQPQADGSCDGEAVLKVEYQCDLPGPWPQPLKQLLPLEPLKGSVHELVLISQGSPELGDHADS